jgi:hypothetical protein
MPTIERVAALNTYRLDANDDAFRVAFRIGNILVLENFRTAVLIIDRSVSSRTSDRERRTYSTIAE